MTNQSTLPLQCERCALHFYAAKHTSDRRERERERQLQLQSNTTAGNCLYLPNYIKQIPSRIIQLNYSITKKNCPLVTRVHRVCREKDEVQDVQVRLLHQ